MLLAAPESMMLLTRTQCGSICSSHGRPALKFPWRLGRHCSSDSSGYKDCTTDSTASMELTVWQSFVSSTKSHEFGNPSGGLGGDVIHQRISCREMLFSRLGVD